jgi:outer membrane protein OmpA-like peptidoglycan-associated protein
MNTTVKDSFVKIGVVVLLLAILGGGFYFFLKDILWPPSIKPYSVVFVISPGSNSRTINFDDNPELLKRINRVIDSYGYASIIIADGRPANETHVFNFSVFRPDTAERLINDKAVAENVERLKLLFFEELRNARNQVAERDVLEAIDLASRVLSSRPADEIREIVVISSGLATSGWLNFADQNEWLYSNATEIINILTSNKKLPYLENKTVSWFQMFDTCNVVQDDIPGLQRDNLEAIWRLIVESAGGEFERINAHPGRGIYEGTPFVTPVKIRPMFTLHVSPAQADVQRGTSFDFSARVVGDGINAQDIEWVIDGPAHQGTHVASDGRLVVAPDDPRENIILIAISTEDRSVSGQANVRLHEEALPIAVVRDVSIFPDNVIMGTFPPYNIFEINATVGGENNPSQEVRFELYGNNDPNTRIEQIDQSGKIFIGQGETAIIITIRAISAENPTIYSEMAVRIFSEPPGVVEVMFLGNSDVFANKSQARAAIGEWVDFINSQDTGIFLFGCTANTGRGSSDGIVLGAARAQAVKDLFVREFNVDPDKITIRGLGYKNIWNRPNGISGTSSWDEVAAAANRKVVIMSADDLDAVRIYDEIFNDSK